ncbi:phosphonate C-P lyase system protein PhnH [Aestuariispira insulae]|uniref:Alpha-D-ribose 1-methylphosphonate 5-triphosphate synthase subunit PhnH n=1 Tax=Aestuariispira insulae TaxID=1461337 RepID=A0A3D9H5V1_9PROT|nr:phosphonate C-P lyase system protein PhnH [Aestuariispira insulae]RED44875.1 alpha-D-ribose 1-methylphosphonate 5-triphosphate synthase subunit PhnH [Aestuariispira insulae]
MKSTDMDLKPAFSDPVMDSTESYRVIMQAMAKPAYAHEFPLEMDVPGKIGAAAGQILLTMADGDTPLWIAPELRDSALDLWIRFHTGCPLVERPEEATFVLATPETALKQLEKLSTGSPEYPDRGATVILVSKMIKADSGPVCSGPGFKEPRRIDFDGASPALWSLIGESRMDYPAGLDWLLVSGQSVAALPRSTKLEDTTCM